MAGALVKAGAFVYVGNGRSAANAEPDSAAATTIPPKICFIEISSKLSAARAVQPDAMQTCTTPARRRVTQRVDAGRFSRFGLHLNGECGAPDTPASEPGFVRGAYRQARAARRQAPRSTPSPAPSYVDGPYWQAL